ncbi:MAG: LURP-one-related family protein [Clostridia bacterium]|nr:LURP-one-related family protein [Clostridia bacterium]
MRVSIKQKVFSFGDKFSVNAEDGTPIIYVEGKVFSVGNKLKVLGSDGSELFYIEQKVFKLLPEYRIFSGGQEIAFIKKEFTFLKPKINITSTYGNFTIDGNMIGYNFSISKNGKVVGTVSKKFVAFSDSYTLDIFDEEENIPFLITLTIVIDQILHDGDNRNSF